MTTETGSSPLYWYKARFCWGLAAILLKVKERGQGHDLEKIMDYIKTSAGFIF